VLDGAQGTFQTQLACRKIKGTFDGLQGSFEFPSGVVEHFFTVTVAQRGSRTSWSNTSGAGGELYGGPLPSRSSKQRVPQDLRYKNDFDGSPVSCSSGKKTPCGIGWRRCSQDGSRRIVSPLDKHISDPEAKGKHVRAAREEAVQLSQLSTKGNK